MDALILLIPIALALGLVGLVAFMWSLRSGQFDDLDGAAFRALRNDDGTMPGDVGTKQEVQTHAPDIESHHKR